MSAPRVKDPTEGFWRSLTLVSADPNPETCLRESVATSELDADTQQFLLEQGPRRLLVYRKLVRRNIQDALGVAIPRTIARLEDQFEPMLASYLETIGPRSHYLRDLTTEFLDHAAATPSKSANLPRVPDHWIELGRLEAIEIEVAAAPNDAPADDAPELDLDQGLRFTRACRLLHFMHAVHRLPSSLEDRTLPTPASTHLLAYRDREHEVRYLELSPVAATLTKSLLEGKSLGSSVSRAAHDHEQPLEAPLLESTASYLADLVERGIVLGTAPPK